MWTHAVDQEVSYRVSHGIHFTLLPPYYVQKDDWIWSRFRGESKGNATLLYAIENINPCWLLTTFLIEKVPLLICSHVVILISYLVLKQEHIHVVSAVCDLQGVTIVKPIVFGNVARYFGKKREEDGHTHQWSVYVKPYRNEVSRKSLAN